MDEISSYLRLFGLSSGVSKQTLKEAYKRLAKQWHPDRFTNDPIKAKTAEEKIKEINIAYAVLKLYLEKPGRPFSDIVNGETAIKKEKMTEKDYYDRAVALVNEDNYQEATEELSRAIKLNPNFAEAYRYRGFLFSLLGFELRAEEDLKKTDRLGIRFDQRHKSGRKASSSGGAKSANYTQARRQTVNSPVRKSPERQESDEKPANFSIEIKLTDLWAQDLTPIYALAATSNGRIIAAGHEDGAVSLWNSKSHRQFHTLMGHTAKITCLKFGDNNQLLFSGSEDGTVRLWNLRDGIFIKALTTHEGAVTALDICQLRKLLITAGTDGAVRVWDLKKNILVRQILNHEAPVSTIVLNSTGEITVCGTGDGSIRFCHTLRGGIVKWMSAHRAAVCALAFSIDSQYFVSASIEGEVILWHFPSGDQRTKLPSVPHPINSFAFCQNGKLLVGLDGSGKLWVWNLEAGTLAATKLGQDKAGSALLSISENGLLWAGADGKISQWQLE
jgi:COMPASS component SWD3